jgi:putative transcriptional regulator
VKGNRDMGIVVNLDVMMAKRKIGLGELAQKVDLTPANLSILKTGKAKAIRFSTLEAICNALECQPGDILEFENSIDSDIENNINQANNYSPKTNKNEK